jgi:hypothetical protein
LPIDASVHENARSTQYESVRLFELVEQFYDFWIVSVKLERETTFESASTVANSTGPSYEREPLRT